MKKLISILVLFVSLPLVVMLWSCHKNKDEAPNLPTVTINGKAVDTITVDRTYTIFLKMEAAANQSSNSDLASMKLRVKYVPGDSFDLDFPLLASENKSATRLDTLIKEKAPDGQVITITCTVTDKDGQVNVARLVANVYSTVKIYENDTFGDQDNLLLGSSWSYTDNKRLLLQAAKATAPTIDFCYVFDVSNAGTLAAPGDSFTQVNLPGSYGPATWAVKNATTFRQVKYMDDSAFTAQTATTLGNLYITAGTTTLTHTSPLVDPHSGKQSFFAFKTAALKYGIVRTDLIDRTNNIGVFSIVISK